MGGLKDSKHVLSHSIWYSSCCCLQLFHNMHCNFAWSRSSHRRQTITFLLRKKKHKTRAVGKTVVKSPNNNGRVKETNHSLIYFHQCVYFLLLLFCTTDKQWMDEWCMVVGAVIKFHLCVDVYNLDSHEVWCTGVC